MTKKTDIRYWFTEARKALAGGAAGAAALVAGGFVEGAPAKVIAAVLVFLAAAGIVHQTTNTPPAP